MRLSKNCSQMDKMWIRKSEPEKNKPIQSSANEKRLVVADDGDGGDSSAGADGDTVADGGKLISGAGVFSSATRL